MNKKLYDVVDEALRYSGVANCLSKSMITKRLRNIIMNGNVLDFSKEKSDILVFVHDPVSDFMQSFIEFVGCCFQKTHGRRILYSTIHHLNVRSGKTIIVLITE